MVDPSSFMSKWQSHVIPVQLIYIDHYLKLFLIHLNFSIVNIYFLTIKMIQLDFSQKMHYLVKLLYFASLLRNGMRHLTSIWNLFLVP